MKRNTIKLAPRSKAMGKLPGDYTLLLDDIKRRIRSAQYEALKAVNKELIGLYWDIGRIIVERQRGASWGKAVVETLAGDLRKEFPGMQGFSASNLWRMKLFHETYAASEKLAPLVREIGWTHNLIILERCGSEAEREFYMQMARKFGWTKNVLALQIENQTFEKTRMNQTNFDRTVPAKYRDQAKLAVKDEYTFDFLELGDEHSEREGTEKAAAESAFLKLYAEVWLPKVDASGLGLEIVAVGGRPLQTTLNEKKEARIHDRVIELLTNVQPRLFDKLTPAKILDLFKLGEGAPPALGIRSIEVVNGFYSFLGFTRLINSAVIRRTIARGVKEGVFGYTSGAAPTLGADGKFQVARNKVRFETDIAEDEVDLESGFILMPQAIPQPAPATPPAPGWPSGQSPVPGPGIVPATMGADTGPAVISESFTPADPAAARKLVEFSFTADRDGLFAAWNALANLADMSGKVTVSVRAESEQGFDKSKLQNGVLEPLKEADLIP